MDTKSMTKETDQNFDIEIVLSQSIRDEIAEIVSSSNLSSKLSFEKRGHGSVALRTQKSESKEEDISKAIGEFLQELRSPAFANCIRGSSLRVACYFDVNVLASYSVNIPNNLSTFFSDLKLELELEIYPVISEK
jgi:hypothetical protein